MSCYESIDIRNLAIKAFCEVTCSWGRISQNCPFPMYCKYYERFNARLFELVEDYQANHDCE